MRPSSLNPLPRIAASLLLSTLCLVGTVHASVLYDEATGGDLQGNQATPALVGTFVGGLNSVKGHISRSTNIGGQGDTFALRVAAGQTLQSLSLVFSNGNNPDPIAATVFRAPIFGQTFIALQQMYPLQADGTYVFSVPGFLQAPMAQDYFLGLALQFGTGTGVTTGTDWQWNATVVSAVPEPSGAVLACAALGVLGALSRRGLPRFGRSAGQA